MIDPTSLWLVILSLGLGTYLIRLSFLGLLDADKLPPWVLLHLRYTAVSVIPALIAPLVAWPAATGGKLDPPRLIAVLAALGMGVWRRNLLLSLLAGTVALYGSMWLLGQ